MDAPADKLRPDPTQTHVAQELKHTSPLLGCRIDPSGHFVFAGAQDNTLQRWELASGKRTALEGHKSWTRGLAFAARDKLLLSGDYNGRVLWWPVDADAPTPLRGVDAHDGWIRALAVSPDEKLLASCGNDRLVKLWNIADGTLVRELAGHENHVYNVAFHPSGEQLVSGDLKGVIKVWDAVRGTALRNLDASVLYKYDNTFKADHGGIRGMTFTAAGTLLACAGITNVSNAFAGIGNPLIVLFDWASGKLVQRLQPKEAFQGTMWNVVWHPADFWAGVGGGSGGALWFWKPEAEKPVAAGSYQFISMLKLPNNGRDLSLHPDGFRLAVAHADGAVRICDMRPKPAK
jgi:WD40 repeat protein